MSNLSKESQALVDILLDGQDAERKETLAALPNLPDKGSVAAFLVEHLPKEEDGWARAWIVSALAAINGPDAVKHVAAHLDPDKEEFEWARYWAAIGLAKMQPANLKTHLARALDDPHIVVKAVALRLLIENGFEDSHVEELSAMARESPEWEARWTACKVLRREAGHQPLREGVEKRFIPVLVDRLHDDRELMDVRHQAAMALGGMVHGWQEAIDALGEALKKKDLDDLARRSCVDGLAQIGRPETKEYLLFALRDTDAEIRVRAARALKGALGASAAVAFIVEELLRLQEPPMEYFDALRQIDSKEAANILADHLLHPDPDVAARASYALTRLGGEEALRTLQAQRTKALDKYTELLGTADTQVMAQFERLMKQAQRGFLMSMWMHGIIFGIGVVVLIVSLYVAISQGFETFERYVGIGAAVGSLGTLLLLFYKDPLKNIRNSVTGLVKVNVVFLGYVRQINQIDATFKQLFLASAGFGTDQMKQTVEEIRDSVKQTMAEVKSHLGAE
jgi:HEAT repeat protein